MPTKLKGTQIDLTTLVASGSNNLVQARIDGLYVALAGPVTEVYVSSTSGSDTNPGTRAAPFKTLFKAVFSFPDYTSGTIYLKEGETFEWRDPSQPTFGSNIGLFGIMTSTSNRSLTIVPYGTQTDAYDAKTTNTNFYYWTLPDFPRPTIQFGHWMWNGTPVTQGFAVGSVGQRVSFQGMKFAFTSAAITAASNSSSGLRAGGGYYWPLESANASFFGCVLPAPITDSSGNTNTWVTRVNGFVLFWNSTIPAGTAKWLNVGDPSRIQFSETGTMTDSAGVTYTAQSNTTTVNVGTRTDGVSKDSNGFPRNVQSNYVF